MQKHFSLSFDVKFKKLIIFLVFDNYKEKN